MTLDKAFRVFCLVTVGALVLAVIFDLLFFAAGGASMTLSAAFWKLCKQYPVVAWALGVLNGHLVWQYNAEPK